MKKPAIIILAILFLACTALAQEVRPPADEGGKVANPPESLQLEYKFKTGEYRRYDMTIIGEGILKLPGQTEISKMESRSELTFIQHVKAHLPKEGIWRMELDMIRGDLTIPEFGAITLTIPSLQFEMDKYGKISKVTGLDELAIAPGLPQQGGMAKCLEQLLSLGFPQRELKAGDSWEQEYTVQVDGQDPVSVKTTSRLLGYEALDGADCAKILTSYETPFKLSDKNTGEDESRNQPVILTGTEKGEFCMHFAYGEGRIMRLSGATEITADLEGRKVSTIEPVVPGDTHPETAAEIRTQVERLKHDISMKFTMTSVYNPKMPESAVERKK